VLATGTHHVLGTLAQVSRALPLAHPRVHGVEVTRDVRYCDSRRRAHLLDVYRPRKREQLRPVVLYIHGGGFGIMHKDSHWLLAMIFARAGYVVFNISYRLAPTDPFPAAIEDACDAYAWVVRNARTYGGDADRIVLAGDSAGGNLITALTLATCYRRDEPYARRAFDTGVVPRAVVPTSAIFQVSDCARFGRARKIHPFITWVLVGVERAYLRGVQGASLDLADPVCALERGVAPDRPLPPFFVAVGTKDPLLPDTKRLEAALARLGAHCEARYYEGAIHVFHAAIWRRRARDYWREAFRFLNNRVANPDARQERRHGPIST
jgi:acetyl esterase